MLSFVAFSIGAFVGNLRAKSKSEKQCPNQSILMIFSQVLFNSWGAVENPVEKKELFSSFFKLFDARVRLGRGPQKVHRNEKSGHF